MKELRKRLQSGDSLLAPVRWYRRHDAEGPSNPFNVERWFAALSLVCIILMSAASALLLSRFLTQRMLERDAVVSMEFIESTIQSDDAFPYFTAASQAGLAHPGLEEFFVNIARLPEVARASVYGAHRTIIWSNDGKLIGRRFRANPEVEEAFGGGLVVSAGTVGAIDKPEQVTFGPGRDGTRFVINYIPIWDQSHERVLGVVELYKLPEALFAAIREGNRQIWISAFLGGLFLYAVLFGIARHANRVIRAQHRDLAASETLAAVGEMASAVAHSIRNPLASIRSSAELALEDDPEHARRSAADIVREADRLHRWVAELLGYLRPDQAPTERIDVNTLVREQLKGFAPALERQHITLSLDAAEGLPGVRAHAPALDQVFNCLVTNAMDAMPEGGQLVVCTRWNEETDRVTVLVHDTGQGLSRESAAGAFQPFTTTKHGGLGVGLSLSRRIVQRYGGSLELENGKHGGATAALALPAVKR
jgi:two-component system sensor histidine kinase HydH